MKNIKKLWENNERFAHCAIINHYSPDVIKWKAEGSRCSICYCGFTNNSDLYSYCGKGSEVDSLSTEVFIHGCPVVCWDCWEDTLDEEDRKIGCYKRAKVETFHSRSIRRKMIKTDIKYKKMEPKLLELIEQDNKGKINRLVNQIACKHKWVKWGVFSGYTCQKCNYHTEENKIMNELIKKLLNTK